MAKNTETGEFGPIYRQFKLKPKAAINFLMKVKCGEAIAVMHRVEIGYIDIIWGENDTTTNKGFGLKHIIEKHGKEIKRLGFEISDFIVFTVMFGKIRPAKEKSKILIEGDSFRVVILTEWRSRKKQFVLTAFDLVKK